MIHPLIDATKVVGKVEIEQAPYEVCAEAVANHDRSSNQLTVTLSAFLRSESYDRIGERVNPAWLPTSETVKEHVELGEAHAVAEDVFSSWCHKVAKSIPH